MKIRNWKFRNPLLVIGLVFALLLSSQTTASAEWEYDEFDDGFDKSILILMVPTGPGQSAVGQPFTQINCTNKKIYVYVWVEYADGIGWNGTGKVKFDSGATKNFNYTILRNFDGIVLKDPKTFMKNLVAAKRSFSFKIPNIDGYAILDSPKSDLMKYRPIFAKAGCTF